MENTNYIQAYCRIRNQHIILNGEELFVNEDNLIPKDWVRSIYKSITLEYPKFHKMDLMSKATLIACELINRHQPFQATDTTLVFSNRGSSYVSDRNHTEAIQSQEGTASPAVFVYTLPNIALGEVCIKYTLHGENNFFIFDKFAPDFLVDYHNILLADPQVNQLLGGWVEVEENNLDILVFLIGKKGKTIHSVENLTTLYSNN